jgi:proteasome activator subunit 4
MFVGDIFTLLLPGIDLNDPAKTGLSCMAISNMVDMIRLGDISEIDEDEAVVAGSRALRLEARPKVADDPNDPVQSEMEELTPEDVNSRVRFATAAFRDWVPEFLERVLLLIANLPEEGGRSGRAGGKTEALTLQSVLVSDTSDLAYKISTHAVAFSRHWTTSCTTQYWSRFTRIPLRPLVPMLSML